MPEKRKRTGLKTRPYRKGTARPQGEPHGYALDRLSAGGREEERTGLKTRHYKKGRDYGDFHGADQEVPEGARLIQSMVWEPEYGNSLG